MWGRLLIGAAALVGCTPPVDGEVIDIEALLPAEPEPGPLHEVVAQAQRSFTEVSEHPDMPGPTWAAAVGGLRSLIGADSVLLQSVRDDSWSQRITVTGFGRADLQPVQPATVRARGERVVLDRGPIAEWYERRDDGVEQGFLLARRPKGTGAVRVQLSLEGGLVPDLLGDSVAFHDESGSQRLVWSDLVVYDADGVELEAWFEVEGCVGPELPCALSLAFDDADAVWPVMVDPLLSSPEAQLGTFSAPGFAGTAVAVSKDWLAVGVSGDPALTGQDGHVVVFKRNDGGADAWNVYETLEEGTVPGFGRALAMDYPWLAVASSEVGAVVMYRHDGGSWVREAELLAPPGAAEFGAALALDQDTLIVGAPGQTLDSGRVYMYARYVRFLQKWALVDDKSASSPAAGQRFGSAIAASSGLIVVGAPRPGGRGAVDLLRREGENLVQFRLLAPSSTVDGDDFGAAVAVHGLRVVVGAPGAGTVHVFDRDEPLPEAWGEAALLATPPGASSGFGMRVAVDPRTVIATDLHTRFDGTHHWRAHLYERDVVGLTQTELLEAGPGLVPGDVALMDGVLAMGWPGQANGEVALSRRDGNSWSVTPVATGDANEGMGLTMAFDGRFLAVGSPYDSSVMAGAGSVSMFTYEGRPGQWDAVGTLRPVAPAGAEYFGFSLSLNGGGGLAVGLLQPFGRGEIHVYEWRGGSFIRDAVLREAAAFDTFGNGLGISVSMGTNMIVAGSPGNDRATQFSRQSDSAWAYLNAVSRSGTGLGTSVSMSNGLLAVALPDEPSVAVFKEDFLGFGGASTDLTWPGASGRFGSRTLLDGDHLVVVDPLLGPGGTGSIVHWLRQPTTDTWTPGPSSSDPLGLPSTDMSYYGMGLAIDGDRMYVGNPLSNRVEIHDRNEGGADNWGRSGVLVVTGSTPIDAFGTGVAAHDGVVVVGAPGAGLGRGEVHAFYRDAPLPPIAHDDFYTTDEDDPLFVGAGNGVLGNDTDGNGDALTATTILTPPDAALGSIVLQPDGGFQFTPVPDANGTTTFTYEVTDGTTPVVGTALIQVVPVQDAPVALPDHIPLGVEDETLNVPAPGILLNDTDADGDPLEPLLVPPGAANGTVTLYADGSLSYTPDPDFNGTDSFDYRAFDGMDTSPPVTVTIDVAATPDAPLVGIADLYVDEDSVLVLPEPGLLDWALDGDGEPLRAEVVAPPAHGSLFVYPHGALRYEPDPNFFGDDPFGWRACNTECSNPIEATVHVASINDVPVAAPDSYTIPEDNQLIVPVFGGLLFNDSDVETPPNELTVEVVTLPPDGTLSLGPGGDFTYTPNPNANGLTGFTYRVRDPDGALSAETPVAILVKAVNDTPVAMGHAYTFGAGLNRVEAADGVLRDDFDPDGDPLTAIPASAPQHGTLDLEPSGAFEYTPDPGYLGADRFTYRASDLDSSSGTAVIEIVVNELGVTTGETATTATTGDTGCDTPWYPDDDEDGYGDDDRVVTACVAPDHHIAEGGDCDDSFDHIYPGAREIEGDDIDQDCDGVDNIARPTVATCATGPMPTAVWLIPALLGLRRR